ncbi:MAG: putative O-glycosylation ligase, exosortase A system-associated [Polaromonas sp.]|nr:putative O-glycosylation ligase, exosortase A system-associated [Polaromonas sp.]
MRDLMFATLMLLAIPLAIARPINAYYLWGWTAVLIPTSYFYGFMSSARLNFVFAVLTLALVALGRVKWSDYQPNRVTWLYLLFFGHATLVFLLGYEGNPDNARYYELLLKSLVFCLLMPLFINSRLRIHVMLLVIVLGLGLHGVVNGLKTLASAGGHNMTGPAGTMLFDRNHLSTALALVLPIIYYLYLYTANKLVRLAFLGAFAVVALAIMGGGSRGGFIALSVVGVWLIMTSRHRLWTLLFVGFLGIALYYFGAELWTDRLSTIQEAGVDESFVGRMVAWKVSSAIALSHPFFGAGFHAVQVNEIWDIFKTSPGLLGFLDLPVPTFSAKAAHSIYFEVMGDMGFVGFFLFIAILLQAIHSRFAIKRMVKELGGSGHLWARDMADMLMLSVIAYMAGGAAVSLGYLEVTYMVIMLMELLRLQVAREVAANSRSLAEHSAAISPSPANPSASRGNAANVKGG